MTTIDNAQGTNLFQCVRDERVDSPSDSTISKQFSKARNSPFPTPQNDNSEAANKTLITDGGVNLHSRGNAASLKMKNHSVRAENVINTAKLSLIHDTALVANHPAVAPSAQVDATSIIENNKLHNPLRTDPDKRSISTKNKVINILLRTALLAAGFATVMIPIAMGVGLPFSSVLVVIGAAFLISAAVNSYIGWAPEKFAVMLGNVFDREPKNFTAISTELVDKLFVEVKVLAGASLAATTAIGYNATLKGAYTAGRVSYTLGKELARRNQTNTIFACATAAGIAVGTVEKSARPLVYPELRTGAATAGFEAALAIKSIQGSIKAGEMAGYGVYTGAFWGRRLARRIAITDPNFALICEKAMIRMGGKAYGIYETINIRSGGHITRIFRLLGSLKAAHNFVGSGYLHHLPPNVPDAHTNPSNTADLRNLSID